MTKKLLLLCLLNLFDGIATYYGIENGIFEEGNPLLSYFSAWNILLIKVFFSIMVVVLIIKKIQGKKHIKLLINIALFAYGIVFCVHVYWIAIITT